MRQEDINKLNEPYTNSRVEIGRRFHSSIGADIPSAGALVKEIFGDLDTQSFGIYWWASVNVEERILISDYLYQCAESIETNLVEAKLHYLEWLHARERHNERIADVISRTPYGEIQGQMPPSKAPIDDLPNKLEGMHVCGFFRAIGSSLDCLGGAIINVLGLSSPLRWNDIGAAGSALKKLTALGTQGSQVQLDFRDFYETVKKSSGPEDWLEWTTQYRNMFVHRGRRIISNQLIPREVRLYDSAGQVIPRMTSTMHLAKYPDKSDMEAWIRKDVVLNEDADITLRGIFKSCRDFEESICERLVSIWLERRKTPSLIEQPSSQWNKEPKACKFAGYKPEAEPLRADEIVCNPTLHHRMLAAAVDDAHRSLWANSKWNQ